MEILGFNEIRNFKLTTLEDNQVKISMEDNNKKNYIIVKLNCKKNLQ